MRHDGNGTSPFAFELGAVIVRYGVLIAFHPVFPEAAAVGSVLVAIPVSLVPGRWEFGTHGSR